ncbi:hypothetical protein [Streptomyces sp. B6B3]|uniref:hypothetical protein n=1 Tax=Streptomyces sp. B6B3 TaxID=3153570 RepID=UPI00325C36F2
MLGDSLSDIGNKWTWPSGELGRMFGAMRVNETGRFSDGKNWTDFLVDWCSGESLMWGNRDLTIRRSADFRRLSRDSVLGVNTWEAPEIAPWKTVEEYLARSRERDRQPTTTGQQITYVNYAMGGCIVTRDWGLAPKFGMLTDLREQVTDYVRERGAMAGAFSGATLHVIWIGLNDFVTVERPDYDPGVVTTLPTTNDFAAWQAWSQAHPEDLSNGVGAFPAVAEVRSLVEQIRSTFPDTAQSPNHFMVIDLPSVYNAIRYMEGLGEPRKVARAAEIDPVIRRYNALLDSLVHHWPAGPHAPAPGTVHLVRMSRWMDHVSQNLDTWKLSKLAQEKGVPVFYRPGVPGTPDKDPAQDVRRRITTSDLGHPTEAVYSLMTRYFVTRMLESGYTLGRLTRDAWAERAPFRELPLDVPN